jgi:hypothetical protein
MASDEQIRLDEEYARRLQDEETFYANPLAAFMNIPQNNINHETEEDVNDEDEGEGEGEDEDDSNDISPLEGNDMMQLLNAPVAAPVNPYNQIFANMMAGTGTGDGAINNMDIGAAMNAILGQLNLTIPNQNIQDDVQVVIEKDDLNKMGINVYEKVKNKDTDSTCLICMDELYDDDIVRQAPCKHTFHRVCIDKWLKKESNKCPVCRSECGKGKALI